jgi:hypothetical protein
MTSSSAASCSSALPMGSRTRTCTAYVVWYGCRRRAMPGQPVTVTAWHVSFTARRRHVHVRGLSTDGVRCVKPGLLVCPLYSGLDALLTHAAPPLPSPPLRRTRAVVAFRGAGRDAAGAPRKGDIFFKKLAQGIVPNRVTNHTGQAVQSSPLVHGGPCPGWPCQGLFTSAYDVMQHSHAGIYDMNE